MKEIDGIEVWTSGEPNRRFKVLGVIDQSHFNNGSLLSLIASLNRDSELITAATEHGGDAIVFIGANSVITGYSTVSAAEHNYAFTHANKQESLQAAVIKYLD